MVPCLLSQKCGQFGYFSTPAAYYKWAFTAAGFNLRLCLSGGAGMSLPHRWAEDERVVDSCGFDLHPAGGRVPAHPSPSALTCPAEVAQLRGRLPLQRQEDLLQRSARERRHAGTSVFCSVDLKHSSCSSQTLMVLWGAQMWSSCCTASPPPATTGTRYPLHRLMWNTLTYTSVNPSYPCSPRRFGVLSRYASIESLHWTSLVLASVTNQWVMESLDPFCALIKTVVLFQSELLFCAWNHFAEAPQVLHFWAGQYRRGPGGPLGSEQPACQSDISWLWRHCSPGAALQVTVNTKGLNKEKQVIFKLIIIFLLLTRGDQNRTGHLILNSLCLSNGGTVSCVWFGCVCVMRVTWTPTIWTADNLIFRDRCGSFFFPLLKLLFWNKSNSYRCVSSRCNRSIPRNTPPSPAADGELTTLNGFHEFQTAVPALSTSPQDHVTVLSRHFSLRYSWVVT